MGPQTQVQPQANPQAGSSYAASDGTQLDPTAVTLAKSIRQVESGGNYQAKGQSGEYGAYQFMPGNFASTAKQFGLNPNDESPVNQDKVAYAAIENQLKQGKTQSQIASWWNSGRYDPTGLVGVNKYGVKYNTPAYVNSVKQAYQHFASGAAGNPNVSKPQPGGPDADPSTGVQPQDNRGIVEKLFDWAFPIVPDIAGDISGKNSKSALQQLGDLGLSALWFAPGLGELGEGAVRGAQLGADILGETGTHIAGQALGGAALGYGADVASNLSQGKTDGSVFSPGMGTLTGGAIGGIIGKLGSAYSDEGVIKSIGEDNNAVLGQTKRGAIDLAESASRGKDTGEFLATKGINLKGLINPDTIGYDTAGTAANLRNDAGQLNDVLTEALQAVPGTTKVDDLESQMLDKIANQGGDKVTIAERQALVQDEFSKIRAQYGDELTTSQINDLKQRAWNLSKWDATKPSQTLKTYRMLGNSLKTTVESNASKAGLDGVADFNDYVGTHLDTADQLDRLHGIKAKGGRLGDMLRQHALGVSGAIGGAFGGGPIGSIVGGMAGEYAGTQVSGILRKIAASPIKSLILQRIEQEDPAAVQKMLQYVASTPKAQEVARQLDLFTPEQLQMFVEQFAPQAAPAAAPAAQQAAGPGMGGMIGQLITKGAVQLAR